MKCIDCHTHLLEVVKFKRKKNNYFSKLLIKGFEYTNYSYVVKNEGFLLNKIQDLIAEDIEIKLSKSSLFHLETSMDEANVGISIVHPVYPNIKTEDILPFCDFKSVFPFSAPETDEKHVFEKSENELKRGCLGMKIHPLIQKRNLSDSVYLDLFEICASMDKPMLTHFGGSGRMFGLKQYDEQLKTSELRKIAKSRPQGKLIVGHTGLWQWEEVIEAIEDLENVFVDISFQSPQTIAVINNRIGSQRILLGSDFPVGSQKLAVRNVMNSDLKEKCKNRILYENALNLFKFRENYNK